MYLTQFSMQQTQHLTLNMMQAYALPGLLHVIALTGIDWIVELKIKHKNEHTAQKSREIITAEWRTLTSGPILQIYVCMYSFPLPFITHELIHPSTTMKPRQDLNLNNTWGNTRTVSSKFYSTGSPIYSRSYLKRINLENKN